MNLKEKKEQIERLKKMSGETRGVCLKTDWDFVLREKGKEGIKKLEEKMAEWGVPLKYSEIETIKFYPVGWDGLSLLAMKEVFSFNEEDFERIGRESLKGSLFLKIFIRYFFSFEMLKKEAPKMWRKHYTVGDLEILKLDPTNQEAILQLKNFDFHPEFCATLRGYFSKLLEMIVKKKVFCRETKCTFKGDDCHEFLLYWEDGNK